MDTERTGAKPYLGDEAVEKLLRLTVGGLKPKIDEKDLKEIPGYILNRLFELEGLHVGDWDKAMLKGDKGDPAGFAPPTAHVANNEVGIPYVEVTASGPSINKLFHFEFYNLKGETGERGPIGPMPPVGTPGGAASLGADGKVPTDQLPPLNYVPLAEKAVATGIATLNENGKVPTSQLPPLNYIPTTSRGSANGVASLGADGKVPESELPLSGGHVAQATAPTNTKLLWIDTANGNIIKFWTGSDWETVKSVWA